LEVLLDCDIIKRNSLCYYLLYGYKNEKDEKSKDNDKESDTNLKTNKIENKNIYDINQEYQKYFFNNNFHYDEFLESQESNKYPLFNLPLFFDSLIQEIPPDKCPSFAPERKKTKDLQTKIPDPNESWGHFFKRLANMELYNPPLVDKKNVSQMNSLYMNAQMKLIENEYGIKMQFNEVNDTTRNVLDQDLDGKESDIFKIQNTEKKPLNEEAENCSISKSHLKDYANNNILNNEIKIRNKEKKIEEIKDDDKDEDKDENVCIIKINKNNIIQSEDRLLKEKKEEEEN
jgi:hypothetical protein